MGVLIVTTRLQRFARLVTHQSVGPILIVNSTAEGGQALARQSFSACFVDYFLLQDGYTGMRFLKTHRNNPNLQGGPIWLMADYPSEDLRALALQAGAAGLIQRSTKALHEVLAASLQRAQAAGFLAHARPANDFRGRENSRAG